MAPDGDRWRLLFEARSYRTALKQAAVFAFDGVVRDIAALTDRRCVGIMVTFTGCQGRGTNRWVKCGAAFTPSS